MILTEEQLKKIISDLEEKMALQRKELCAAINYLECRISVLEIDRNYPSLSNKNREGETK